MTTRYKSSKELTEKYAQAGYREDPASDRAEWVSRRAKRRFKIRTP